MNNLEQLPHPEFLPYPNHYTAGFFADRSSVENTVRDLEDLGYKNEDFNLFEGPEGVKAIDVDGLHHNLLERFMRKFIKFSDAAEWRFLNEADREIRQGSILLCVPTPNDKEKWDVIHCFKQNHAYDIRYFSPLFVEEVE